jgi:hypothetical protein
MRLLVVIAVCAFIGNGCSARLTPYTINEVMSTTEWNGLLLEMIPIDAPRCYVIVRMGTHEELWIYGSYNPEVYLTIKDNYKPTVIYTEYTKMGTYDLFGRTRFAVPRDMPSEPFTYGQECLSVSYMVNGLQARFITDQTNILMYVRRVPGR